MGFHVMLSSTVVPDEPTSGAASGRSAQGRLLGAEAHPDQAAAVRALAPTGDMLIVEDSPEDFHAIRRTLHKLGVETGIQRFGEGEAFFEYLRGRAERGEPLPSLMLLDLNMPGADGREVLVEIEADARFSGRFPIVVLSTSSSADDVGFCEAHGAASYMTKPVDLAGLEACLDHVRAYLVEGRPLPARC